MPVIATAAWSVPKAVADRFPGEGSILQRYAAVFPGVEINSTFYRSHRSSTYERWAASVGDDFRFAVKIPKDITHVRRLKDIREPFSLFLQEISPLGDKIGPLLCQLPPSLRFEAELVRQALGAMRESFDGRIALEVRHVSWADADALAIIREFRIERVLADPALVWPKASFDGFVSYMRLHGSPEIYYSRYTAEEIADHSRMLGPDSWCVFDNTAAGAATENALEMLACL
jgi:uncharacterized protein YecE (DUF72 family)